MTTAILIEKSSQNFKKHLMPYYSMYKIKQLPEDFVVIEISQVKKEESGKYLYFRMKKIERNTLDVVQELARRLQIREKDIGFAGSKDKHAVTEQMISVIGIKKEDVGKIRMENVSLEFYTSGKVPLSLGDLLGNEFKITTVILTTKNWRKLVFWKITSASRDFRSIMQTSGSIL